MEYVESFDLFGTDVSQIPCIVRKGKPTTETAGAVGCQYMDEDTGEMYKCIKAADGVYTWEPFGSVDNETIAEIKRDIADLKYIPIDITQITGGMTVEMGSVVNNVTIGWALNKEPTSQTLGGESVDVSERSKALTGLAISANTTFPLAVTDERGATDSASASISFLNGVYYGVLEQGAEVNSAAILTLTRKLQGAKGITFTANAGATQQIVYALPTRYGTPGFNVGGFDGGFAKAMTFDFTNASGYTESYDVWLSENVGLGSTTVKVS